MKKLFLLTLISTVIYSQEEISNDSLMMIIDSLRINQQLLANQQKMLENQQKILNEVIYVDPLIGKKFGIELNPIGMLFSSGERVRGSITIFPDSLKGEINFPISSLQEEGFNEIIKTFNIDAQYKKFIGKHRKGFYFSGGLRYSSVEVTKKDNDDYYNFFRDLHTEGDYFGLSFGLGFRLYGKDGQYWGTGMYGGKYFNVDDNSNNPKTFFEIELLKFGMYF